MRLSFEGRAPDSLLFPWQPIPGCPAQCFPPPAFLHPEPISASFIEQELLNVYKVDTAFP